MAKDKGFLNEDSIKKMFKYFVEWFVIVLAAKFIPSKELNWSEIIQIAIVGAIVFAVLDMYSPTVSDAARKSTGIALGIRTLAI